MTFSANPDWWTERLQAKTKLLVGEAYDPARPSGFYFVPLEKVTPEGSYFVDASLPVLRFAPRDRPSFDFPEEYSDHTFVEYGQVQIKFCYDARLILERFVVYGLAHGMDIAQLRGTGSVAHSILHPPLRGDLHNSTDYDD